jgi:hypothetical protein
MMQVGNLNELPPEIKDAGFPIEKSLKILGTILKGNCEDFSENFIEIERKVKNQINIWSRFNLSLTSRINIAKTMMYSQVNYNGCFLPIDNEMLTNIEEQIIKYVVGKGKMARDRVFKSTEEGGLGLFRLTDFLGAQQCSVLLGLKI